MGLFDIFNKKHLEKIAELESIIVQYQLEISTLKSENKSKDSQIAELNKSLSKYIPLNDLQIEINKKKEELNKIIINTTSKVELLEESYQSNLIIYNKLKEQIKIHLDTIEPIEFGLYQPIFDFETSDIFKKKIKENHEKQRSLIKENKAITSNEDEIYYKSEYKHLSSSYKKSINSYKKLISLAFNSECDALISKVKWNNIYQIKSLMTDLFYRINNNSREFCSFLLLQNYVVNGLKSNTENFEKKYKDHMIEITKEILDLKIEELSLNYEYKLKKQEEMEEARRVRELMREEEKARREFEQAQRDAEKEEATYQKALDKARKEYELSSGEKHDKLQAQIEKLEQELREAQEKKERALSMAQQTKRGHVYVISNIGSFGENVYKIGMTRRLEPEDRVKELGDASVPFRFDIHAMIYSDEAPTLENELHKAFTNKKVNMLNYRKEFFNVTLDEIENKVKEIGLNAEFSRLPEAMEYRETLAILEKLNSQETPKTVDEIIAEEFPMSLTKNE